jgi:asparaginyl-tRNA synthetase
MKFFADRIDKDCVARLEAFVKSSFRADDVHRRRSRRSSEAARQFEFPVRWGMDLQSEHERWLTEEHVKAPVVVMNYPKEIKAFYMRHERRREDGGGDGRAGAGHRRDHRRLTARRASRLSRSPLAELGSIRKSIGGTGDLRGIGTVPHRRFGLGLERTIIYATGMATIRT